MWSDKSAKLLVILLAIYLWPGSGSWFLVVSAAGLTLRPEDVNLILPSIIRQGDDLTMYCHFDSNKFPQIYSVKWYKGNREFFRYTPKESPAKKSMDFGGIEVDKAQCDLQKVHIRKTPIQMAGNITCEVTTDNDFRTALKIKSLTVIVESETPPVLQVFPNNSTALRLLTRLKLRCTAGPSKPAANITFYINDAPYNDPTYHSSLPTNVQYTQSSSQPLKFVKAVSSNETGGNGIGGDKDKVSVGLETRKAEIQINLTQKYFRDSKIRIKCAATIYNVSQLYSETYTGELYTPPREAIFSSYGNTNGGSSLSPGKLVWSITTTTTTTPITTTIRTCVSVGKLVLFFPLNILLHQRQLIL